MNALEQASIHVADHEFERLNELYEQMIEAIDHARRCNCPNHRKQAESATAAFWKEADRLNTVPYIDHEEQLIADYAIFKALAIYEEKR